MILRPENITYLISGDWCWKDINVSMEPSDYMNQRLPIYFGAEVTLTSTEDYRLGVTGTCPVKCKDPKTTFNVGCTLCELIYWYNCDTRILNIYRIIHTNVVININCNIVVTATVCKFRRQVEHAKNILPCVASCDVCKKVRT